VKKLILGILAFLLTIFPGCGMLLTPYQSLTFPGEAIVTDDIMNAIVTRDIATLENMVSSDRKQTMEDLPGNIGKLIDTIEGEITDYQRSGVGYNYDKSEFGTRINRRNWDVVIETTTQSYTLIITWTVVNNRAPEEVGMRSISLLDLEGNELATTYVPKLE